MLFSDFVQTIFEIMEMESVPVLKTTNFKEELEIDSLQMVNFVIRVAEHYRIPFEALIQNTEKMQTVGGLFEVIESRVKNETN